VGTRPGSERNKKAFKKVSHMISNRSRSLSNLPNAFPGPLSLSSSNCKAFTSPTVSHSVLTKIMCIVHFASACSVEP
jgi:hypothetical protein